MLHLKIELYTDAFCIEYSTDNLELVYLVVFLSLELLSLTLHKHLISQNSLIAQYLQLKQHVQVSLKNIKLTLVPLFVKLRLISKFETQNLLITANKKLNKCSKLQEKNPKFFFLPGLSSTLPYFQFFVYFSIIHYHCFYLIFLALLLFFYVHSINLNSLHFD